MALVNIDYQSLIDDYETSLNSKMRGFCAAEQFLETWVPDPDLTMSLLNLIEAAHLYGQDAVRIYLNAAHLPQLDLAKLQETAQDVGNVTFEGNGSGGYLVIVTKLTPSASSNEEAPRQSFYEQKFDQLAARHRVEREGELAERPGARLVVAEHGGIVLSLLMDDENHTIVEARHRGTTAKADRALLDLYCQTLAGTKILDASDHSVIALEYALRDEKSQRPVKGIVTPKNADPKFAAVQELIRTAHRSYREKTGYNSTVNFYDRLPSRAWLDLSKDEKLARLTDAKNKFLAARGVGPEDLETQELVQHTKVYFEFHPEFPKERRAELLFSLELELKERCDAKIEVFRREWRDKNDTRKFRNVLAEGSAE